MTNTIENRQITLYPAKEAGQPFIVFNDFSDEDSELIEELNKMNCPDINLLTVIPLDWDTDMTPWPAPPLSKKDEGFKGGADEYLTLLTQKIIPKALENVRGTPCWFGIAGYSLSGLFSLYALYRTTVFKRAASMSGSLWYPGFLEFVKERDLLQNPDKIYLSLGDAEKMSRHPMLKTVEDNTRAVAETYALKGVPVTFELNPGNHFKEPG